jgi:glycosyltransferase involved in cell wall biosynthesis
MALRLYKAKGQDFTAREPLVSVVTPFYNTAEYLEECIESVLAQSYTNWEYTLADNCSTDGSGNIAKKFASLDSRIRVIHETEFIGQTQNYNRAVRYISPESKYCKIVQADDWIYPNCLEEMVAVAEQSDRVGLISSFSLYDSHAGHRGLPLAQGPVYPGREAARIQLFGDALFGSPTCVMYRSDIVRSREPFFSLEPHQCEDAEVCFEILRDYDFGFVPQVLTFNRRDNISIWTRLEKFAPRLLHRVLYLYKYGADFLTDTELAREISDAENNYYRLLTKGILCRYGKDFWDFHTEGLATIKMKIKYSRMFAHFLQMLANKVFNPKQSIESVIGLMRKQ